jgi:hypothetical protein
MFIFRTSVVYPEWDSCDGISMSAWNLVQLLLTEPDERVGRNGISDFKKHELFKDTNWNHLRSSDFNPPPFVPELNSDADTAYFEDVNSFFIPLPSADPVEITVDPEGPDLSFAIQPRKFVGFTFKRIVSSEEAGDKYDISTSVRFEVEKELKPP